MPTKKVKIQELGFKSEEGKSMILRFLDDQIKNYKLKSLSDWERNHDPSVFSANEATEKLTSAKQEFLHFFESLDENEELDFSLQLEVKLNKKS